MSLKPLPWLLALSGGLLILVGFVVMVGRLEPEVRYVPVNVSSTCGAGKVTLIWPSGTIACASEDIVHDRLGR